MSSSKKIPYSLFTPTSYWSSGGTQPMFTGVQYGVDTSTGKRDMERAAENLTANPFTPQSIENQAIPQVEFTNPFDSSGYEKFLKRVGQETFKADVKQQLLGLGSGLAYSAAAQPFATNLRGYDLLASIQADAKSPTRQAQRDSLRQQQFTDALGAQADYLRALAAVRQGAASGVNVTI